MPTTLTFTELSIIAGIILFLTSFALCVIFSVFGFALGLCALIKVKAQEKSTHKIEWRTVDPTQVMKDMEKAFNPSNEDPVDYDAPLRGTLYPDNRPNKNK